MVERENGEYDIVLDNIVPFSEIRDYFLHTAGIKSPRYVASFRKNERISLKIFEGRNGRRKPLIVISISYHPEIGELEMCDVVRFMLGGERATEDMVLDSKEYFSSCGKD